MATTPTKRTPKGEATPKVSKESIETLSANDSSVPERSFLRGLFKLDSAALVIGVFILFGMLLGAIYAFWPTLAPHLPPLVQVQEDPRLVGMEGRVQALESLVQKQRKQDGEIKSLELQRSQFTKQLSHLMERLGEQEKALSAVKQLAQATTLSSVGQDANESLERLSGRLKDLEQGSEALSKVLERIAILEEEAKKKEAAAVGSSLDPSEGAIPFLPQKTVLAVLQLREALRSSAPFANDLDELKTLLADRPEIMESIVVLEPHMRQGIPTLAVLRSQFESLASHIVRAGNSAAEKGWVGQTLDRLSSLVSIRKSGANVKGTDVESIVAQAEAILKTADLPSALNTLDALPDTAKVTAADWMAAAKARIAAERAMASLHVYAIAYMAPVQDSKNSPIRAKE